jgi:glycosyltransferase involved in cell wall biosynthesis
MTMISVIIPLGPNEMAWQQLLPQLVQIANNSDSEILLLVTSEKERVMVQENIRQAQYRQHTIKVLSGKSGRAALLNLGVQHSVGKYLWFLHADSVLPADCYATLLASIRHDRGGMYYFDLAFLPDGPCLMPVNSLGVYFRSHFLKLPFGDQGFFMARAVFDRIGPYNEAAEYGEDHLLVWQAHQQGIPVLPMGKTLKTSARKYKNSHWAKTTLRHLFLTAQQAVPPAISLLKSKFI